MDAHPNYWTDFTGPLLLHAVLDLELSWGTPQNGAGRQEGANNGNLLGQLQQSCSTAGPSGLAQNYWEPFYYDAVNRVTAASDITTNGTQGSRTMSYDQYGNMWVTGSSGYPLNPAAPTSQSQINAASNRLAATLGAAYDAAGNMTSLGSGALAESMTYDAENRQTTLTDNRASTAYTYDGDGKRVTKTSGGVTTVFVYDAQGELAAEYGPQSAGGGAAACQTCYLSWDHLGTTRMVTDQAGNIVARHDFMPFGEEIVSGFAGRTGLWGDPDGVSQKFTGKERDLESGLDYFGARFYGSALGRFTSPDPLPGWAKDPQSWNMYAYGRNNPLKYTDPDGETYRVCDSNGQNCNDLSDADFESEQKSSQSNGEHFNNGSLYHYDSNGGRVNDGTYNQTDVDIDPAVASALHTAGVQSSAQLNAFMRDAAMTAAGGLVFSGAAAAVTELAPAAESLPLLRQVAKVLSNNSLKHIAKHLDEFQQLDPSMTMDKIVAIGTDVAQTGSQVAGNAFTKTVQIGGQEVTVRAVLNSNNALRSVHILQ